MIVGGGGSRGSGFAHSSDAMTINVVTNGVSNASNIKPDESNTSAGRGSFRSESDPFAKRNSGRASYSVFVDNANTGEDKQGSIVADQAGFRNQTRRLDSP